MPSDHSSSSHSSSSSDSGFSSYSGGSSSDYSGGFSGGGYNHDYRDYDRSSYRNDNDYIYYRDSAGSPAMGIIFGLAVIVLLGITLIAVNIKEETERQSIAEVTGEIIYTEYTEPRQTQPHIRSYQRQSPGYGIKHDSIYVSEIGRNCVYDAESDNYFDYKTKCYFWLNNVVEPPVWQYWYEGISSDYKDYGWMEYDYDEHRWYIETSEGNWEVLPEKYDTSRLWHLKAPYAGKYNNQNSVYVLMLGRYCAFDESLNCYYDPETNVYFYYNAYLRPAQWIYWFEGYGWMLYDAETEKWYNLGDYAPGPAWTEMPHDWKPTKLWHI